MASALKIKDVAEVLNVNQRTVYRLVQRGDLPAFKVAGTWRFLRDDVDAWVAFQKASFARSVTKGAGHVEIAESSDKEELDD